jgi:POLO box duplicated region
LLSDSSNGVHFNDGSKIVAEQNSLWFTLILREKKNNSSKHDVLSKYNFENYPVDLEKKVDLFKHFNKYLVKETTQAKISKLMPPLIFKNKKPG